MVADTLHQDMYAYDIYSEYLERIQHYALNSTINSLSIRYYKINIPFTTGIHEDIGVATGKRLNAVYDIYDFVPVLESQPLTYTVVNDEESQGVIRKTQSQMTILALEEPLPYDIFNFYQMGTTNEFFYVTEVNFVHSVRDLNIYQLTFETAPVTMKSVDEFNILNHFYYSKEFNKFFDQRVYENYAELLETKDDLVDTINEYYSCIKTRYTEENMPIETEAKVNSMLMYLEETVKLKIQPILNMEIIRKEDTIELDIKPSVEVQDDDCYIVDPDYVIDNIINDPVYDPHKGEIELKLATSVRKIQDMYYKFIYYRKPEDDKLINDDVVDTTVHKNIRDLDGNII